MTRTAAAAAVAAALTSCAAPAPTSAVVEVGAVLTFAVEVADTEQAQRDGLSGRTSLSEGSGMLFPFDDRGERHVWMAGMEIPIDVAWIVDNRVLASTRSTPAPSPTRANAPAGHHPATSTRSSRSPPALSKGSSPAHPSPSERNIHDLDAAHLADASG